MNRLFSTNKKVFVLALAAGFFVTGMVSAFAQQSGPQFLITWRAKSYAPADYKGKVFPGANSPIAVSFELLSGGKLLNLAGQTIYWYLNGELIDSASGKQMATFNALDAAPNTDELQIELPEYQGGFLVHTITIPIVSPEVVIEAPYPGGNFSGTSFNVGAVPYFFNVASPLNLSYSWTVNGTTPPNSENPQRLVVNLNSNAANGSNISVGLVASNPQSTIESASADANLVYVK